MCTSQLGAAVVSSASTPAGVQGRSPRRPRASRPALISVGPSTSLCAGDAIDQRRGIQVRRQRQVYRDAGDVGVCGQLIDHLYRSILPTSPGGLTPID
jgi:hypothetical protein